MKHSTLAGRVALVTGASSGIGAAIARRLAAEGMKLALLARRAERLEQLRSELDAELLLLPTDLRDEAAILRAFDTIRSRWGGVDVLINNAGLGRKAPLSSGSTEAWREMLEVNVLALCICTREAVQDMKRNGRAGHVLHVSSMSAHRVPEGSGVYSATKFAVRSLTEGLRRELNEEGSPIRVSSISPGFVETEFAEVFHGDASAAERTYGRYKVLESEDVAEAVLWMLSQPEHVQVHDLLVRPRAQPS